MKNKSNILKALSGVTLALGIIATTPANATVTEGEASAYAIKATIYEKPLIGPAPYASATGNSTDSMFIGSIKLSDSRVNLSTHLLDANASSNVGGSTGAKTASSSSSMADVDFNLAEVLGLSFDLISSNSTVTGESGSFSAIGNSSIVNLSGSGLLAGLGDVTITGAPNQTLLSLAGLEVIANRQTSSCTSFECSITTDALYIDVLGKTSMVLASSSAYLAAPVPEPATAALMMAGLAGLGSKRFRKMRTT
jgi:hypothetical protein